MNIRLLKLFLRPVGELRCAVTEVTSGRTSLPSGAEETDDRSQRTVRELTLLGFQVCGAKAMISSDIFHVPAV